MAPQIARLHGITVSINSKEHLPPHFHACYGEDEVLVEIRSGLVLQGEFPNNKFRLLLEWLNQEGVKEWLEMKFYEWNPRLKPNKK